MKASEQQRLLASNATTGIYELRGFTSGPRGIIEPMCDDDAAMEMAADLRRILEGERKMTPEEDAVVGHIVREWQRLDAACDPEADNGRTFENLMDKWWPDMKVAARFAEEALRKAPAAPTAELVTSDLAISEGERPF